MSDEAIADECPPPMEGLKTVLTSTDSKPLNIELSPTTATTQVNDRTLSI